MNDLADIPVPPDNLEARRAALQRMLSRLGAPRRAESGYARSLAGTEGAAIEGILSEIDEAIMPRRLHFQNHEGASLDLEVRNRRLFWAGFGDQDNLDADVAATVSDPLSYAGAGSLAAFGRDLLEFCRSGGLKVESRPAEREPELEETGVSAETFRHLLHQPHICAMAGPEPSDTLVGFSNQIAGLARSWILLTEAGCFEHGEPGRGADLARALQCFTSELDQLARGRPLGVILSAAGTVPDQGAFFVAGATRIAAIIHREDHDALMACWSRWLAGTDLR